MKKCSIIDVARHAQVGIGTVSRVINGSAGVTEYTKAKVRRAMADLGYLPLPAADRRGPKRKFDPHSERACGHIELVYQADLSLGLIDQHSPIYEQILEGIEQALEDSGHRLETRSVNSGMHALPAPHPACVGRIYFGTCANQTMPPNFPHHLPSVWIIGIPPVWYMGDVVFVDHLTAGKLAAREAIRQGGDACLFVGWSDDAGNNSLSARRNAFEHWVHILGGTCHALIEPGFLVSNRSTNKIDQLAVVAGLLPLLISSPLPDAICVQADILLPSVYAALDQARIPPARLPKVITCNNEPIYRRNLRPNPIVIDIHGKQLGMLAISMLFSRIANPEMPHIAQSIRPGVLKSK